MNYLSENYSEYAQSDYADAIAANYVPLQLPRGSNTRGIGVIKVKANKEFESTDVNQGQDVILVLKGEDYCDQSGRCIHEVLLRQSDGKLKRAANFLAPLSLEVSTTVSNGYRDLAVIEESNRSVWSFNGRKYLRKTY